MALAKIDPDSLIALAARRHPDYAANLGHWNFCEETYDGGRAWFGSNIHRGPKEGDVEYGARIDRAYRFNHTREIVDLIDKYIFKSTVARKQDAPEALKLFWKKCTLNGLDIDQFMRLNSGNTSKLGMIWLFVDSTKSVEVQTVAEAKRAGARTYAYAVKPQNVLDASFADDGSVNWVLVRETVRDDENPIDGDGNVAERFRLWMKDHWYLWTIEKAEARTARSKAKPLTVRLTDGVNALGEVPGFPVPHTITDGRYSSPALINDIAYLDKAVANYLSNVDAIIQDQTFSTLVMPAGGLLPGSDEFKALLELGTKRFLIYDGGEGGNTPNFISPDPKQAGMVLTIIDRVVAEIYHSVGIGGERTNTDNAAGTDTSSASGVAKAYDFERLNSLLVSKSKALENAENRLARLVLLYDGVKTDETAEDVVKYADTFDVRSLYDEFTIAEKLVLIEAPDAVRREQMTQVVNKLFPDLAKALKDKMAAELLAWPKDPIEEAGKLAEATNVAKPVVPSVGKPKPSSGTAKKGAATADRRGEVTADTGK